ncbi:hypothetical protein [Agromyces sp. Leaf222]|uniref:hypothetical protein n=1 Tax=Agromyces sp. Leaf222 TaxID=1735688 RepID=UPI000ADD5BB8|nr:hypothetical protein [Agromyces sp. Leaf222]
MPFVETMADELAESVLSVPLSLLQPASPSAATENNAMAPIPIRDLFNVPPGFR